jgi:hypothetical protein
MKSYRMIGVLLVVIACVVLAGAALANRGSRSHRQSPRHPRVHAVRPLSEQSAASESESESATDSESGQQGEPAQGHEDPPGDVNHECTGDCQE